MKNTFQFNALQLIEQVHQNSKDSQLNEEFLKSNEVMQLADYLQLQPNQTALFATAFILSFSTNNMFKVLEHFDMQEYQVVRYHEEIELLFQKRLLKRMGGYRANRFEFEVGKEVMETIKENKLWNPKTKEIENLVDILEEFEEMIDLLDDEAMSGYKLDCYLSSLPDVYPNIELFQKMRRWKFQNFDYFFLMSVLQDAVFQGDNDFNTHVQMTIDKYCGSKSRSLRFLNHLLNGSSVLIQKKLVELSSEKFKTLISARLGNSLLDYLQKKENIQLKWADQESRELILAKSIQKKELYYNREEGEVLVHLKKMLKGNQFNQLQKRLSARSMPTGINVLLHGHPGTGKTESVYQLAKESGRNIFKVDISSVKSMWYGESQKLVKRIFEHYDELKQKEKKCPILLFNEADGIIGKRKAADSSSVAETENAIQNILLEEMEKFNGILFATTNLVDNIDSAFERRFLFKVDFKKPEATVAAKIWQYKLNFLSENEALDLATEFNFSGGEVENIARKIMMAEILDGIQADYEYVRKISKSEKWNAQSAYQKIGFN